MLDELKKLSEIERQVLLSIENTAVGFEEISEKSKVNIDSVRRAAAWLQDKGFASISEIKTKKYFVSPEGEKILEKDMPEKVFLETLKEMGRTAKINELKKETGLDDKEFTAALGKNKRQAFIVISQGEISLTGVHEESKEDSLKEELEKISKGEKANEKALKEFLQRGLIESREFVQRQLVISSKGEEAKKILSSKKIKRVFDVEGEVPKIFMGKKAPYVQFLKQIREKLVALGFNEMDSPIIVPEFYNFDVLFQPQNHPARTWTDTYLLKQPSKGKLPEKKKVDAIKAAHENGGKAKSTGWGYKWSPEIAARLMPSAHGTAHSARQLVSGVEIPKKYFAIARCFRPDVLDATHLLEFNQMEGFIVGEDLNFKHLLGMLKEFAIEVAGAEKVKFFPDYYPFTEPSVQLSAKHPEMGWIEFAGAGMFRPEMLENLGIKGEAIAWGMGIDRLAMFKLGIKDIRYLFAEDLGYLRKAKGVLL
jgi:phenylalanyl-tRNA synthetase alpha chain